MIKARVNYNFDKNTNLDKLVQISFRNVTNKELEKNLDLTTLFIIEKGKSTLLKKIKKFQNVIDFDYVIEKNHQIIDNIKSSNFFYFLLPSQRKIIKTAKRNIEKCFKEKKYNENQIVSLKSEKTEKIKKELDSFLNSIGFEPTKKSFDNRTNCGAVYYKSDLEEKFILTLTNKYIEEKLNNFKDEEKKVVKIEDNVIMSIAEQEELANKTKSNKVVEEVASKETPNKTLEKEEDRQK